MCVQCQVSCSLVAHRDAHVGYRWRCRQCNGRTSLRKGSFFKCKIELGKLVWILFSWATGVPSHHVAWHLGVSPRTMVDWTNFIGDVCAEDTGRQQAQLGGSDSAGSRSPSISSSPTFIVGHATATGSSTECGCLVQWRGRAGATCFNS